MDVEPQLRRHAGMASFGQRPARQSWSPRARRLIEESCALSADWLGAPLKRCLDAFDQSLYQQAERSRNHLEQQRCFDSRALLDQQRVAFAQRFIEDLSDSFARLDESDTPPADDGPLQPLSLLDRNEHELNTALDKLAARGEGHNSLLLSELGYRFAVLVAMPPLEGDALPPSPANLARALRTASEPMQLPIEHRLLLLQVFEQTVTGTLGKLYESLNAHLLDDGILPQLRTFSVARSGPAHAGSGRAAPATTDEPVHASEAPVAPSATAATSATSNEPIAVLETLRDLLARGRTHNSSAAAQGRAATADELQVALDALQQHLVQVTDKASRELRSAQRLREELVLQLNTGKPLGAEPTQLSAEQDDTVELVAMLFEQLGQQLHQGPHARALLGDLQLPMLRLAVTDHDFFDQREHPGRRLLSTVAEAANDWLDGPDGETDGPLLARLEQLVERARREPPSAGLYTTLLADIEHHLAQLNRKAQTTERRHIEAMQGREKLDQARHRASELMGERFAKTQPRGLLRALLERAWSDVLALTLLRHGEDSETFAWRLRITDQLLGQLPVDDPALLRQEVEAGLQQIGMHAEEAEQVAQRLIGTPVPAPTAAAPQVDATAPIPSNAPPAPTVARKTSVTKAASKKAPAITSSETATVPAAMPTPAPAPEATAPLPVVQAQAPMASAIPHPTLAATTDNLPSATDLALRLKQRQRLGEQRSQEGRRGNDTAEQPPLGPQEARIHNRLRQLPFGSWFEFADPAGGAPTALKLAWFSPISGNSLFVTRRGQRGEEMNLRELARAMASGRVREMPAQRDGLLDRAWHSLTSNLLRPTRSGARP
ncbi:DUF1631 family protein [Rhodanobacter glycinis]|uniref:DUF1631 domain-containing protein n=1 Tax=Rhodanobacter glycinis TaxID=582702 RepID=A0A1I3ZWH6_9GAMM|nr:DUF1631 family protein [Rhodanobacter glycinis]SFK47869.1 Protein of unknown function [Rhodanobacter glycinis]